MLGLWSAPAMLNTSALRNRERLVASSAMSFTVARLAGEGTKIE
jgi:hypothetical protein